MQVGSKQITVSIFFLPAADCLCTCLNSFLQDDLLSEVYSGDLETMF